jgi:hypothetical protein
MAGNYEQRKVARNEFDWGFISTAQVTDGSKPYETAVKHDKFNKGNMVIVESYNTKQEALEGHTRWIKTMSSTILPQKLVDCNNCELSQLGSMLGMESEYDIEE